jgi:hypothetical protein
MINTIGVNTLYGLTPPAGGFAHNSSRSSKRPVVQTKNDQGVTVFMDKMPHQLQDLSIKGTGSADLALAVATNVAAGVVQVTGVKYMHELGKRPEFEVSAREGVNDA